MTSRLVLALVLAGACFDSRPSLIGASCETGEDCVDGVCHTFWPQGYCSSYCETHADCRPSERCVVWDDGGYCYYACWYDEHCSQGFWCFWIPFAYDGICVPYPQS